LRGPAWGNEARFDLARFGQVMLVDKGLMTQSQNVQSTSSGILTLLPTTDFLLLSARRAID
jgi:hypothetical protein